MTFKESLEKLGIADYAERIWNSNSRGELFHTYYYMEAAGRVRDEDRAWFRPLFESCVRFAESRWTRPESCFQHMPELMADVVLGIMAGDRFSLVEKEKIEKDKKES